MKLYIQSCHKCGNRTYIAAVASNRSELRTRFGGEYFQLTCPNCQNQITYHISEVQAEPEKTSTVTGSLVGGLIGLIGGPVGLLIGGSVGGAIGNSMDSDEQRKVDLFNSSL